MVSCSSGDDFIPTEEEIQIDSIIKQGYEPCHHCRHGTMDLVFISKNLSVLELPVWQLSTNQKALHCKHCKYTIPLIETCNSLEEEDQVIEKRNIIDATCSTVNENACDLFFREVLDPMPATNILKSDNKVVDAYNFADDFDCSFGILDLNDQDLTTKDVHPIIVVDDDHNLLGPNGCDVMDDLNRSKSTIVTPCEYFYQELIVIATDEEPAIVPSNNPSRRINNTHSKIIILDEHNDKGVGHARVFNYDTEDVQMIPIVDEDDPSLISRNTPCGQTSKQPSSWLSTTIDPSQYGLSSWKVLSI
jgi:hypothetical protein